MSRTTSLHTWGTATRTTSGAATGIRVGSYHEGQWVIHIRSMSGTNPRLQLRWESAPGTPIATAGPFGTLRALPTLLATGVSVVTLLILGSWGRPAWTIGGTSAAINVEMWFVGSW
jgi:hypothetical protein